MDCKQKLMIGVGTALFGLLPNLAPAAVSCPAGELQVPVSGKILNNAVQPGTTLGTVHLTLGADKKTATSLKCGILGSGGVGPDGSINFVHTFVCDDQVSLAPGLAVHSQLSLNTSGTANAQACPAGYFPPGATSGGFTETSTPIPGTGRGIFTNVTAGEINVDGTINCAFAIDMKFSGAVCLPIPQ